VDEDFIDLLGAFADEGVRFMVVGAHAMAVHGVPRATGDLDVWIEPTAENAERIWRALATFGAPLDSLGIALEDFVRPDMVVELGLPPRRIDLMTGITGVSFPGAWAERIMVSVEGREIPFLGRRALTENKRATGRPKDLSDLDALPPET
jgi:hypothetical protein